MRLTESNLYVEQALSPEDLTRANQTHSKGLTCWHHRIDAIPYAWRLVMNKLGLTEKDLGWDKGCIGKRYKPKEKKLQIER